MKTGDMFYSTYGRVVHSYWGEYITCVTDDFGNAVTLDKDQRALVGVYIRQGD